jgi:hypothetical protein
MNTLNVNERIRLRQWFFSERPRPSQGCARKWVKDTLKKDISQAAISRFLSDKCKDLDNPTTHHRNALRVRAPRYEELEKLLFAWQLELEAKGTGTSGELIREFARKLWEEVPEARNGAPASPCPEFGKTWLEGYKARYHISRRTFQGEAASFTASEAVADEMGRIGQLCAAAGPANTYNMDETGLFWRMGPATTLASETRPGMKPDKSRISLALTTNAAGDDNLPIWAIGKAKQPRALRGFPFGAHDIVWRYNTKAWMTGAIMAEWFQAFYSRMESTKRGQSIVLLMDNFSGHRVGLAHAPPPTNINVVFLPPNSTSVHQPMDQGIIENFKRRYKKRFLSWLVRELHDPGNAVAKMDLCQALIWTSASWSDVKTSTIINCWRQSACFPGVETTAQETVGRGRAEGEGAEISELFGMCSGSPRGD